MKTVNDTTFKNYGKKIEGFDFNNYLSKMDIRKKYIIPDLGNKYIASISELENSDLCEWLGLNVYGGLDIQLGICAGHNKNTTAVEYHIGSEVVVAATDCILPLGLVNDIKDNRYEAKLMERFLLKKGEAVELFSNTLHYSPVEINGNGYITLVALLRGTNENLEKGTDNILLLSKNKYMIVHKSRKDKIESGAYPGLINYDLEE